MQGTVACCMKHKHNATREKAPCNPLMGNGHCNRAGKNCEHKFETINFKRNGANEAIDTLTNAPSYSSVPEGIPYMQSQADYAGSAASRPIRSDTCAKRVNNENVLRNNAWTLTIRI